MTVTGRETDLPTEALPVQPGPAMVPRGRPPVRSTALPIDSAPAAEPVVPPTRRDVRRGRFRRWRARFVLLVALLAVGAVSAQQIALRLERADRIGLEGVELAAEPIDVVSRSSGRVVDILVQPGDEVQADDVLATVDVYRPAADGGERVEREQLVAPVAGVVATIPTNAGAALGPGEIAVQLYQPDRLRFETDMDVEQASFITSGMTGELTSPSTDDLAVTVVSVEPALRFSPDDPPRALVTLVGTDPEAVRSLLPGLTFTGWLQKGSVPRSSGE